MGIGQLAKSHKSLISRSNVFYPTIINDTKEGLVRTGLAFPVTSCGDIDPDNHLFREFLESKGWNPDNRDMRLRIKPAWLHYGGYGHKRGSRNEQEFRRRLKKSLQIRGPYVVQPEIPPLIFEVKDNETEYAGNDQCFFFTILLPVNIDLPAVSESRCRQRAARRAGAEFMETGKRFGLK